MAAAALDGDIAEHFQHQKDEGALPPWLTTFAQGCCMTLYLDDGPHLGNYVSVFIDLANSPGAGIPTLKQTLEGLGIDVAEFDVMDVDKEEVLALDDAVDNFPEVLLVPKEREADTDMMILTGGRARGRRRRPTTRSARRSRGRSARRSRGRRSTTRSTRRRR